MKSTEFLQAAIDTQAERGKQYDSPEGERSMGRTVAAFNAITGRDLTEAEGWLLLQVLKDVRQWQNPDKYHHDSALDGVAYASLKAEALSGDYSAAVPPCTAPAQAALPEGWTDIRAPHPPFGIGQKLDLLMVSNTVRTVSYEPSMLFPDVAAWRFSQDGWVEHDGKGCPVTAGVIVELRHRDGSTSGPEECTPDGKYWRWVAVQGECCLSDIVAYRLA